MNKRKEKKKIILISIIVLVIIALVIIAIITNTNKKSSIKTDYESEGPTYIDWDNMENAKIDKNGNKVCTSKDLTKKHTIKSVSTNKKTKLTINDVKIYGDKKSDTIYAKVPITNEDDKALEDINIDVIFLNKDNIALFHSNTINIKSLKSKETYIAELESTMFDITNTKTYEAWLLD